MIYLKVMVMMNLLLWPMIVSANGQNHKENPVLTDSSRVLTDEYFVEKAYKYIEKHKDQYHTENPRLDFPLQRVSTDLGGNINVYFNHLINGVKVNRAFIALRYRPNGKLFYSDGVIYFEAFKVDTNASISKEQAENIALGALPPPEAEFPPALVIKSELLIDKIKEEFKLIWYVAAGYGPYVIPHEIVIDAHTGDILSNRLDIEY